MKSKRLFQIFVVLVLLFSSVGSVGANSEAALETQYAIVIPRDTWLSASQTSSAFSMAFPPMADRGASSGSFHIVERRSAFTRGL